VIRLLFVVTLVHPSELYLAREGYKADANTSFSGV
jgi:hypothetical protein